MARDYHYKRELADRYPRGREAMELSMDTATDCRACGGDGWLPSLPEGASDCPYCAGTGRD